MDIECKNAELIIQLTGPVCPPPETSVPVVLPLTSYICLVDQTHTVLAVPHSTWKEEISTK